MKQLGKVILHIPAREGSKRVPRKNMKLMNNQPMIAYTIKNSIQSDITQNIYVNTDSNEIEKYVKNNFNIKVYKRSACLANDTATSDQFNYDIIKNLNPDTLVMINPVCPLITAEDIQNALKVYKNSDCDTLISSSATKMQTFCNNKPINININEELAPSQTNEKVYTLNWAITIWDANLFKQRMETIGFASLGTTRLFYELNHIKSIKVSEPDDFIFAEQLLKFNNN